MTTLHCSDLYTEVWLEVAEEVASQGGVPASRTAGGDAGGHGDVFGDQRMLGQDGLQADVGAWDQVVCHQVGVGLDLLEGWGQGIESPSELVEASGFHPAGELAADVRGVDIPGQQEPGLEDGLTVHDFEEILESHGSNVA